MEGSAMSEAFTVLKTGDADRRLLLKLQHRLLQTPPSEEYAAPQQEDRLLSVVFALAPMTLAFLYLMILSFFLFR